MRKDNNKHKKKGASLIYVLVILSIITVFSFGFLRFILYRKDIYTVKSDNKNISKKHLENMEIKNIKRLVNNGITVQNKKINIDKNNYFDSVITVKNGNLQLEKLYYLHKNTKSIGEFQIKKIEYNKSELEFPIEKNKVYKNLKIYFEKEVLGEYITYFEEISLERINVLEVEEKYIKSGFL